VIARPCVPGRVLLAAMTSCYFWSMQGTAATRSAHAWIHPCKQVTTITVHQSNLTLLKICNSKGLKALSLNA